MSSAGLIDPYRAAELLEARDQSLFAERLLSIAHSASGVEELFAYRTRNGAPETLASSSGLSNAEERTGAYARRFYRSDPAVAARLTARPGTGFVCRIPTQAIELDAYRRLCFERPRFKEKICFGWRSVEQTIVVTFYRSRASEPDMPQLGALAQLAITGLTRMMQPPTRGALLVQRVEERLANAHPVLTRRERQVCARTLTGQTASQIGAELCVSIGTVLTYRQRAYQKLGLSKAPDLLAAVMS